MFQRPHHPIAVIPRHPVGAPARALRQTHREVQRVLRLSEPEQYRAFTEAEAKWRLLQTWWFPSFEVVCAGRRALAAAVALLDWLAARELTLATAGQGDLDAWLTGTQPLRGDSGNFVRWARKHKLTRLDHAADRWGGPTGVIDTETGWEQARWLLHDDTVDTTARVAGLLVLLYAQTASAIAELTIDHVQLTDQQVWLRLGREPILIPVPLDRLVRDLVQTRAGHAAVAGHHESPWLFPGGQPGRHLSAFRKAERLRQLGIQASRARSAALFQLAGDLPAAVLARTLGIHISVAAAWQRASSGDWLAYAAEISRRGPGTQSISTDNDTSPPAAETS